MKLCSDSHQEICYLFITCPLCKALETINLLEKEKRLLKEKLDNIYQEMAGIDI